MGWLRNVKAASSPNTENRAKPPSIKVLRIVNEGRGGWGRGRFIVGWAFGIKSGLDQQGKACFPDAEVLVNELPEERIPNSSPRHMLSLHSLSCENVPAVVFP